MMWRRNFLRTLCLAGALTCQTHAQTRAQFQSESAQVLIPFLALDRQDRLVTALSIDDLRLLDNGEERPISFLSLEEAPASMLFIIDVSGSMSKPVRHIQDAVRRILRHAAIDDEFALIEFRDRPKLTVAFTDAQAALEERVREITPAGSTSLIDAIELGLHEIANAHQPRRALVILSDGQDNHSRHVRSEVFQLAMETDVVIYGIEMYPPAGEGMAGKTFLQLLSEATGGRYFPTVSRKKVPELVDKIDIHRSHMLGFQPSETALDGKDHQIELKLRKGSSRLFWKRRYHAPQLHQR